MSVWLCGLFYLSVCLSVCLLRSVLSVLSLSVLFCLFHLSVSIRSLCTHTHTQHTQFKTYGPDDFLWGYSFADMVNAVSNSHTHTHTHKIHTHTILHQLFLHIIIIIIIYLYYFYFFVGPFRFRQEYALH